MSTRKSALKKSPKNKTKKSVVFNPTLNEVANDNPEPITPRSKAERWRTRREQDISMHEASVERRQERERAASLARARRNVPEIAATIARGRFRTGSPPSPRGQDVIQLRRAEPVRAANVQQAINQQRQGIIPRMVGSVFRFFRGRRGGKATRKNRRK